MVKQEIAQHAEHAAMCRLHPVIDGLHAVRHLRHLSQRSNLIKRPGDKIVLSA